MLKCVVIGCGWAGMHHLDTLKRQKGIELTAAVEPNLKIQKKVSDTYHIPVYLDTEELLQNRKDIDIAVVATIPDLHKDICEKLIRAGIHIYCEKPVCRNSAEIRALKELAEENGIRFGVGFNQRFGDAVMRAKELLEKNRSTMHLVTASMYQQLPTRLSDNVREDFMLTDAVCHLLDIVMYLCGPVKEVKAFANKIESDLYSDVGAVLMFENGCIGTVSHSNVGGRLETQHPFQCIDVHTEECRMRIENQFDRLTIYPHENMEQTVYETSVFSRRDYAVSMTRALEAYLKAIQEGGKMPSDITSALVNMQVIEAMKSSIQRTIS